MPAILLSRVALDGKGKDAVALFDSILDLSLVVGELLVDLVKQIRRRDLV
jgi:hypothetical protein